jgi:hypothetical protein
MTTGSHRKGTTIQATSLRAAKQIASRRQMFADTVLVIEDEKGHRLSVKQEHGWLDTPASG